MNYLSVLEFDVAISRIPDVSFSIQSGTLPGFSMNPPETNSPFNRLLWTPDKLNYEPLTLQFIVDENCDNYIEIFNWMKGITGPENYEQRKQLQNSKAGLRSDISINLLNSNKRPFIRFAYRDCMPISLSGINIDTTQNDVYYPKADVTFSYNYYEIERIKD